MSLALQEDSLPAEPQGKPKNIGLDCHTLLQKIFLTQGSNPDLLCLLHCRQILYHWATSCSVLQGIFPIQGSNPGLPHCRLILYSLGHRVTTAAAAAKSLQSCPTLCDPIDGSLPGSAVPGILQARTLEWVAISFSSAWKWKVKAKSLSRVRLLVTPWTAAHQASPSMGFFQARVLEWGVIAFSTTYTQSSIFFLKHMPWR